MVGLNESGQLFTIEGLTAALIMIASAYIVLGTGMVLTPGDAHITDMQLSQLGNDALLMMDTENEFGGENCLVSIVKTKNTTRFDSVFTNYLRKSTGSTTLVDSLKYNSTIYYVDSGTVKSYPFMKSINGGDNPGKSPAVSCSRFVNTIWEGTDTVVRLEVLIWRD